MAEPQLSVRSARARELAHKLAAAERRTVAQVVVQALELYATNSFHRETRESAAEFYARLTRDGSTDLDLDAIIRADCKPHEGPDL